MDGALPLLPYHQRRVDRSRRAVFGKPPALKLAKVIEALELPQEGLFKLRLQYGVKLTGHQVTPYRIRPVTSLKLVTADDFDYPRKTEDRSGIEACYAQREDYDDVLMVKRGYLTDTRYANVALYDGTAWYTPAYPLLKGTRREQLLEKGTIKPALIRVRDLPHFRKARLMNAMMRWEESPEVAIDRIGSAARLQSGA